MARLFYLSADLNQRHPNAPWDDRTLLTIAECYERKPDVSAAVAVYERLVSMHPQSQLAPKALLNIARVYASGFNQKDLARRALERILERFPGTPFAERALELLRGLPAASLELEQREPSGPGNRG